MSNLEEMWKWFKEGFFGVKQLEDTFGGRNNNWDLYKSEKLRETQERLELDSFHNSLPLIERTKRSREIFRKKEVELEQIRRKSLFDKRDSHVQHIQRCITIFAPKENKTSWRWGVMYYETFPGQCKTYPADYTNELKKEYLEYLVKYLKNDIRFVGINIEIVGVDYGESRYEGYYPAHTTHGINLSWD